MNHVFNNPSLITEASDIEQNPFFRTLSEFMSCLKEACPQSADWEIKEIFKKVTGKRPIDFIMDDDYPTRIQLNAIDGIIQKRVKQYPIAHLLEQCEFMGYDFFVNNATFIPRPETELLVAEAIALAQTRFKQVTQPLAVDLGTGSGCIAVSFAKNAPRWKVLAFDVSQDAVSCAQQNVRNLNVGSQVDVIQNNYFEVQWSAFDAAPPNLILVNPPYIAQKDFESLPTEVQKEPYQALIGGERGTEIPKNILQEASRRLAAQGAVVMEIGAGQSEELAAYAQTINLKVLHIIRDEQQHDRIMSFEVNHG